MSNIGVGRRLVTVFCAFPLMFSLMCVAAAAAIQEQSSSPKSEPSKSETAKPGDAQPNSTESADEAPTCRSEGKGRPISREAARREAWSCLMEGLAEKSSDRRAKAISAMGAIGRRPDVVRMVEKGLQDESELVRQTSVTTLGGMKSRSSIPKMRTALDDDSAAVSFAAARALWEIGDYSGLSILVDVLQGDRAASPGLVHSKLHDIRKKLRDPKALAQFGAGTAAGAFLGPAGIGVDIVEEIGKDRSSGARALSAQILARSKDKDAHEALVQALDDKSWIVRASAAQAIGAQGSPSAIDSLAPLLQDSHPDVRFNAAASIVRLSPVAGRRPSKPANTATPSAQK
jgi:HEAT repeat protein